MFILAYATYDRSFRPWSNSWHIIFLPVTMQFIQFLFEAHDVSRRPEPAVDHEEYKIHDELSESHVYRYISCSHLSSRRKHKQNSLAIHAFHCESFFSEWWSRMKSPELHDSARVHLATQFFLMDMHI
jgi:hypothetical protein